MVNLVLWKIFIKNFKLNVESIYGSVYFNLKGNGIIITEFGLKILDRSLYYLFLSLLKKFSHNVKFGYFLELNFTGLVYRFINLNNEVLLRVGYSHYVFYRLPHNILIFLSKLPNSFWIF